MCVRCPMTSPSTPIDVALPESELLRAPAPVKSGLNSAFAGGEGISVAGFILAGKYFRRKIIARIKQNVGFAVKESFELAELRGDGSESSSGQVKELPHREANEECSPDGRSPSKSRSLKGQRTRSLPSGQAKRDPKCRRSQAISFFKSRRDVGAYVSAHSKPAEDQIHTVTDQELKLTNLKQGLSSAFYGLAAIFAVVVCIKVATAVTSSDPSREQAMDARQGSVVLPTHSIHFLAHQLFGFLAACLCLGVFSWLDDRRPHSWSRSCQRCEDMVENSLNRAEEAEQRALKAHRAKQQFMTYVFHNIRVPFNAIVLGLGHLRSTADKEVSHSDVVENKDLIQMMLDCAETMTSVLDDVTDMGQWEGGVIELNLEEFDLLGVIEFLSWGLKDLLYQKQICFTMNVDPIAKAVLASNHVIGDKHRILQTLGNFLSNAVKFTPAGGRLELRIKCEEVIHCDGDSPCKIGAMQKLEASKTQDCSLCPCLRVEGLRRPSKSHSSPPYIQPCCGEGSFAKILITVNDTGIGISVDDQAKLFEPYSFVTSGWVQKAGVSGLGLSMAKRFAEKLGGYIGVQSKEGEGSTFYFCLPYPLVPVKHDVEYKLSSKEEGIDSFTEGSQEGFDGLSVLVKGDPKILQDKNFSSKSNIRRRVLLVEDTEINRIILKKILLKLNLSCEEAENGQVAVDLMKQGRTYDLILMDKEMPVMDGHEATRRLRMMGVKTPIVALTGNALQSDRELFFEAGVDDFQTKPLSRDKLVQLLARFGVDSSCADRIG